MILDAQGREVRSNARAFRQEDLEVQIREKLKGIDSLLDLVWIPWASRYALISYWPQNGGPVQDKRWEMYQRGEIGANYDTIGWFCQDMQDPSSIPVSIDSIENKVLELLRSCDNTIHPWRGRMADMVEKNRKVRQDRASKVSDRAQNMAEVLWQAAGRYDAVKVERIAKEASEDDTD